MKKHKKAKTQPKPVPWYSTYAVPIAAFGLIMTIGFGYSQGGSLYAGTVVIALTVGFAILSAVALLVKNPALKTAALLLPAPLAVISYAAIAIILEFPRFSAATIGLPITIYAFIFISTKIAVRQPQK